MIRMSPAWSVTYGPAEVKTRILDHRIWLQTICRQVTKPHIHACLEENLQAMVDVQVRMGTHPDVCLRTLHLAPGTN
jgi:hypothetical protein